MAGLIFFWRPPGTGAGPVFGVLVGSPPSAALLITETLLEAAAADSTQALAELAQATGAQAVSVRSTETAATADTPSTTEANRVL